MISARLKDEAFLADLDRVRSGEPGLHLWWLGQSGFLAHAGGRTVLFDPYLSDSLTRKYADTDKPHERMTERVVAPGRLTGVEWVTASHAHTDHLDPDTLPALGSSNPQMRLVCPESIRELARQRSGMPMERIVGLEAGGSAEVAGIRVEAVPAAHEGLDRDAQGRLLYLGFVVRWGGWTVYHSGDTIRFPGMEEGLRGFGIDVALLPINGRRPERRVSGNLWGREAAELAKEIGAGCVVPCHYDMFRFNTETTEEFEGRCRELAQPFRILRAGERASWVRWNDRT